MKNFNKIKKIVETPQPIDQTQEGEMTPEEMKADLQQLISKVDSKYQNFNSLRDQEKSSDKDMREKILNQVFETLAKSGVDGSDPQQLNTFLEKIKTTSPELYQFFSEAITSLMGVDATSMPSEQDSTVPNISSQIDPSQLPQE